MLQTLASNHREQEALLEEKQIRSPGSWWIQANNIAASVETQPALSICVMPSPCIVIHLKKMVSEFFYTKIVLLVPNLSGVPFPFTNINTIASPMS